MLQKRSPLFVLGIPFSAFWLRLSVVSVLISLISDMGRHTSLLVGPLSVALALHYCKGRAHPYQSNCKMF
ncbi:hypothetical protein AMTRI_Chr02g265650 [Amborella trichopoda]